MNETVSNKQARLAAALRENLKRRKRQMRDRTQETAPTGQDETPQRLEQPEASQNQAEQSGDKGQD